MTHTIFEGLRHKDMTGIVKPEIHIDEFSSKMGDDDEIVVVSFYVRDGKAADDLVNWFEAGYEYVLDADRSPGEIKPNRYLVYIELKRRSNTVKKIAELLDELGTLTEHEPSDWRVVYKDYSEQFSVEGLESVIPLSPHEYRRHKEKALNEYRFIAGLPIKSHVSRDPEICALLRSAGGI
jgi:hypothetical protein